MAPLKRKTAKQTGRALVRIMATAVIPEVLQFDNGSEFLGRCIHYIKELFKTVNIVKGKPHCPNEQGSVERGNADFKKALHKWQQEYPDEKWPLVGIYDVNHQINTRPTDNKAIKSAYEIYYGKQVSGTTSYILGSELLNKATTEYGIMAAEDLMNLVKLKDSELLTPLDECHSLIQEADKICQEAAALRDKAKNQRL